MLLEELPLTVVSINKSLKTFLQGEDIDRFN